MAKKVNAADVENAIEDIRKEITEIGSEPLSAEEKEILRKEFEETDKLMQEFFKKAEQKIKEKENGESNS